MDAFRHSFVCAYTVRMAPAQRKRTPVNLSLDPELVAEARKFGLNLSGLLEEKLREAMREHRQRLWQAENAEAIASYNRFVAKHGVFGEDEREW